MHHLAKNSMENSFNYSISARPQKIFLGNVTELERKKREFEEFETLELPKKKQNPTNITPNEENYSIKHLECIRLQPS